MAYADQYGSGINLDALVVPVQAATVFAAQENSLYLPGTMVPTVSVPAGSASAQVALMGSVTAEIVTGATAPAVGESMDPGVDFSNQLPANTKKIINLDLIAARTVLRDLGGVDVANMGRIMGSSIAAKIDAMVSEKLGDLTISAAPSGNLLHDLYREIGLIRDTGETGPLNCVVSTDAYAGFMEKIGSSAFANADIQNAAMRSGFIGTLAGVPCYVSSFLADNSGLTTTNFAVFSQDALRIAMQGGVNVEVERRAAAVGNDIVASAAFGVDVLDATRGVINGVA